MARIKNARKEKLSIYLSRDSSQDDSYLIKTEQAKAPIDIPLTNAEFSRLYIKKQLPRSSPTWTKFFTNSTIEIDELAFGLPSNVGAVFIINTSGFTFVLTFGTGFHLLKTESIERDFGLKVTLNSVDPDKLRSLDKASYDHNPLNSRTQSTKDADIFDLHLNAEMEMLYAITGVSSVIEFGSHVTGRDALTIAVEANITDLPHILSVALSKYQMKLHEKFSWVDNINRVKDTDEIEILELELDSYLEKNEHDNFWLGEPEIIDWENQIGYSFDNYARTPRSVALTFENFVAYLKGETPSVEIMKNKSIHVNDGDYKVIKTWSVWRCLYTEISYDNKRYFLKNGIWYKANIDFVDTINNSLKQLEDYSYVMPTYNHEREEHYNESLFSLEENFCLMDKKNIKIGGPYDKLEHCDLIRNGNEFIHVKYYRSSSTLSHLFSQGLVAAEAFVGDANYRINLNPKLPESIRLKSPDQRPDPSKYRIVYAIATTKKIPEELPFFSKITLKNVLKSLLTLNYKVSLVAINIDPEILIFKKLKSKSNLHK